MVRFVACLSAALTAASDHVNMSPQTRWSLGVLIPKQTKSPLCCQQKRFMFLSNEAVLASEVVVVSKRDLFSGQWEGCCALNLCKPQHVYLGLKSPCFCQTVWFSCAGCNGFVMASKVHGPLQAGALLGFNGQSAVAAQAAHCDPPSGGCAAGRADSGGAIHVSSPSWPSSHTGNPCMPEMHEEQSICHPVSGQQWYPTYATHANGTWPDISSCAAASQSHSFC